MECKDNYKILLEKEKDRGQDNLEVRGTDMFYISHVFTIPRLFSTPCLGRHQSQSVTELVRVFQFSSNLNFLLFG